MKQQSEAERLATELAKELAKTLGHAAVLIRKPQGRDRWEYNCADSWIELDRRWKVIAFVGSNGNVVAQ